MSDIDYLFLQLQLRYKVDLYERESVIIFDEVQLCPTARQAIKALVKDGRYDYIETGSLISIKRNVENILITNNNVKANIAKVIGTTLDSKIVKYGASLLGIPSQKMYDALMLERHEINH